jgi:hypothetical protein
LEKILSAEQQSGEKGFYLPTKRSFSPDRVLHLGRFPSDAINFRKFHEEKFLYLGTFASEARIRKNSNFIFDLDHWRASELSQYVW